MKILNIEIKARTNRPMEIEQILLNHEAEYKGEDHQIDTYFLVADGRLKLRQGNIENALIHYRRIETKDLKRSEVELQKLDADHHALKQILENTLGVTKVVDKRRKIFFIDNVKFHIDLVKGLGSFVEIEAIDFDGTIGEDQLKIQCDSFIEMLGIDRRDLIDLSYSDMV